MRLLYMAATALMFAGPVLAEDAKNPVLMSDSDMSGIVAGGETGLIQPGEGMRSGRTLFEASTYEEGYEVSVAEPSPFVSPPVPPQQGMCNGVALGGC